MNVLFMSAELAPFAKVGGLGDVAGELPPAIRRLGVDIRAWIPLHASIDRQPLDLKMVAEIEVPCRGRPGTAEVWHSEVDGVPVYWIDGPPIQDAAEIYSTPDTDARKYVFWALAASRIGEATGWKPDVIHANDWQSGPAVVAAASARAESDSNAGPHTLLTIHNLPFMGAGAEAELAACGIGPVPASNLPEWAANRPLPMGLAAADWISTVSPTYAQEIQTPAYGLGLDPLLKSRRTRLRGIVNGIDQVRWNPSSDPALPVMFDSQSLAGRVEVKRSLQAELGLPVDQRIPVIGMVGRLDKQKGVDLALDALDSLGDRAWQWVLLGTGDPALEDLAREFATRYPQRSRAELRFDPTLARRIYGGADMLLVPSRYEPCGLSQMIAMRYGAVPIVRATGGLKDTVLDVDGSGRGNGFVFEDESSDALRGAILRALDAYGEPDAWKAIQHAGMTADHSWGASAGAYVDLYSEMMEGDHQS
jgi:starch synthase